jgi:tRNA nucleotidyltransferase (CCA-adding enzyme)
MHKAEEEENYFLDGAFEYGGSFKFRGYVGTNAEPLCVEFGNFVRSHTFVNYLSCYF